jgi:CheY-like chemotaxis protein
MTAKKRILIIDDEPDIQTYLAALFEDAGYETDVARNGEEALDKVGRNLPNLITLDISMPEKSGVRFFREIKQNDALKQIPVIIVTGVSGDFKAFISSRHQVPPPDGFLSKPIQPEEILALAGKLTA